MSFSGERFEHNILETTLKWKSDAMFVVAAVFVTIPAIWKPDWSQN